MTIMYLFLQYWKMLKCINHGRKAIKLMHPDEPWSHDTLKLSGLKGFCRTVYGFINHGLMSVFIERCHVVTLSFHISIDEMAITLDDWSCLLHIPIIGRLLDHSKISRHKALDLMVTYSRANSGVEIWILIRYLWRLKYELFFGKNPGVSNEVLLL